jgi:peptide/nickel transport system permease protein
MIPTLFGITVVSFCIMQLAPGDPLLNQMNSGNAGQSSETPEAYELQKRELHLDKPLVLNFNAFRDYSLKIRCAAYLAAHGLNEIRAELPRLEAARKQPAADDSQPSAGQPPTIRQQLDFIGSLGIPDFKDRLASPEQGERLAKAIAYYTVRFCADTGANGVPAAIAILRDPQSSKLMKIGAINILEAMVITPFSFTYSVVPSEKETEAVTGAWRLWWQRKKGDFVEVDADARKYLDGKLAEMLGSGDKLQAAIDAIGNSDYMDAAPRYFAEKLLDDHTPLAERAVSAIFLRQFYNAPLQLSVPLNASDAEVQDVAANWLEHYKLHQRDYEPSLPAKLWSVVADTQYAYMLTRLATFHFGHSALRTREPVSEKIWNAMLVSAPLMLLSQALIYFFAVPLGIICGVYRGKWLDQGISLGLFLLYSIPGFIAGMLFLVFFCYGDYFKWFPMLGLHSEDAERLAWIPYLLDYAWHAFLPVVCLSLFSLAGLAMYSRSSMLDVLNQDYIRTARAKGLSGFTVIFKHGLRNALIPILTLFSSFLPAMLGGSVLIEYLFDIPGMGRLGWSSIEQKDFPTLMALLYVEAIVVLISYLITDVLYVIADPRITFSGRGSAA